jgi:hypothetical protein
MRFDLTTKVAASCIGLMLLSGVTAGCAKKSVVDEATASRIEAAASRAEMAANKAELAAKSAADAAQRAQAAADKAEAMFAKKLRK